MLRRAAEREDGPGTAPASTAMRMHDVVQHDASRDAVRRSRKGRGAEGGGAMRLTMPCLWNGEREGDGEVG